MAEWKDEKCKNCKKKFHICPFCYNLKSWEMCYCSFDCWEKSEEKKELSQKIDNIIFLFSKQNIKDVLYILRYDDYMFEEKLMKEILK